MQIQLATGADSAALLNIYGEYIDTPVTFEYTLPSPAAFADRIAAFGRQYPVLVCRREGRVAGYAYAHRQLERDGYGWNAELSVYLSRAHTSRGLGTRLYGALLDLLALQGVKTAYGVVTLPNAGSEGLHRRLGFRLAGTHRDTGYKCGRWWDVAWFEKQITPGTQAPAPITPIGELAADTVAQVLRRHGHTP